MCWVCCFGLYHLHRKGLLGTLGGQAQSPSDGKESYTDDEEHKDIGSDDAADFCWEVGRVAQSPS